MIILVLRYWTSLNPHRVLMSLWWDCALQLPPTHTLYRQTGTRADAAPMKTDHCGLDTASLSWDDAQLLLAVVLYCCVLVLIFFILNAYATHMCVCVCAPLISQTAPEAPDGWPPIRLSVSQERTPQPGENMMLSGPWGAWRPGGLDIALLISRLKIL